MSDCSICLSGPDGEFVEMLVERVVTARKALKCCECHRAVIPGQKYEYAKTLWEGVFTVYRTCMVCVEIRQAFGCDGWVYEGIWEDFEEYLFEEMNEVCFTRLQTAEAKRFLRERWMQWKGLVRR